MTPPWSARPLRETSSEVGGALDRTRDLRHVWKRAVGAGLAASVLIHCGGDSGPRERQVSEPTARLVVQTEALRKAYAALNRNDIPAMVEAFEPQVEWIQPVGYPRGGTYRGLAAVKAHLSQSRASWAEGSCEPERFIVAGDRIVVFVRVRVRLEHEMEWREAPLADVYTFRGGRVAQIRSFSDRRQALEWAGADPSAAD